MQPGEISTTSPESGSARWDQWVAQVPGAHILQSWQWGRFKSQFGWSTIPLAWTNLASTKELSSVSPVAVAMVLERAAIQKPYPLRVHYVPKGPLLDWSDRELRTHVLEELKDLSESRGAIFIKIDPDVPLGTGIPGTPEFTQDTTGENVIADLRKQGWSFSSEQVQFRNTVIIDLIPSEDRILAAMKQKTRYNIRLASKKGVEIRSGTEKDLPFLYRMYALTSIRDRFVIRDEAYYLQIWKHFLEAGMADILIAEFHEETVAALIMYRFARKAWFMYGMSQDLHREKMPNHLLQWEAICLSKKAGCTTYDLWGAPDEFTDRDPLWGVYRFKEGFGGKVVRHIGAWDYPTRPRLYALYTQIFPRLLQIMRRRGKFLTRQHMGS